MASTAMTIRVIIISSIFVVCFGVTYTPTSGYVWPKPFSEKKQMIAYDVDPAKVLFKIIHEDCDLVQKAIDRFKDALKILSDLVSKYGNHIEDAASTLNEVHISLREYCEEFPHSTMNESYSLSVSKYAAVESTSVWGIIKGLESLSQLFYITSDFKAVKINATVIKDKPQFPYRGYLLDTSRHYISVGNILKTLDAMAMNKLNVFHWHIYDDNSFPYVSSKFPELSEQAAYHSSMVYNRNALESVREYARFRGIRVIIEFDMPGHSASFGVSHPEILSNCSSVEKRYSRPMNPVKNETYNLLKDLLAEVQGIFPDNHFHLGGDEVNTYCWVEDPDIQDYMRSHNIPDSKYIMEMFYTKTLRLLKDGTVPIFWEEVFHTLPVLPRQSYIQVWRRANVLIDVITAGYYAIQSAYYYLDHLGAKFKDYYIDPRVEAQKKIENITVLNKILGGTACMWGEMIDDTNELSRSWPRASAMAETLWSNTNGVLAPDVEHRIEEHVCRMRRRGVPAQPANGPGFCVV